MTINSKLYDMLKSIAMIWLPAATTLYFAVSSIWGIPDTANVIGTMTAFDTFLGGVLGISSKNYIPPVDGAVQVNAAGLKGVQLPGLTAQDIAAKNTVTLKVQAHND